jgi:hypothetical protein
VKWLAVLVLGVLGVLGGVAHAAPIQVPAGWTLDASLAQPPGATRFGGATTKVAVYAYRAPVQGAVLYVNRAEAEVAAADRDKLATVEVEEPRNAMRRAGTVKTEQDSQRFDDQAKQLEAMVTWSDASVNDRSRVIVAGDDKRLVSVTAQCVLAVDAPAELIKACDAALATLDAEVPAASRVALSIVHEEPAPTMTMGHDTLNPGDKVALPPIVVDPPQPQTDRRPVYVGLGLFVLAAVFWWNRRRREKFEAEHGETPKRRKRDEDADDLHAAAEAGDDSKDKP